MFTMSSVIATRLRLVPSAALGNAACFCNLQIIAGPDFHGILSQILYIFTFRSGGEFLY